MLTAANRPLFAAKAPAAMRRLIDDFSLTEEDAAAIVGNGGHESLGFSKLQEIAPTVKGSRGGFGWFQWTGPRRRAFEAYCKRNGLDPTSDQANYAFLFVELSTGESKAIPAVKKAKGLEAKVKAFEMSYERAGVKHYDSRLEYAELALRLFRGGAGAAMTAAAPIVETAPVPAQSARPGVLATLWGGIFTSAKAAVPTAPDKDRPGLAAGGSTVLYDQQEMLSDKGYTEVGKPDGLIRDRTRGAVEAFRRENGLPAGGAIDDKFSAALLAAGPRQIAKARAQAIPQDLRAEGNTQVATLDGIGMFGKLLGLGGVVGGIQQSGVLDKASDTLASVQSTFGTITSILTTVIGVIQWCVTHWWLFAIGGGLYVTFRAAMAVLNMVVLFRQGFLARADK